VRRTLILLFGIFAAPLLVLFIVIQTAAPRLLGDIDLYSLNRPPSYTFVSEAGDVLGRAGAQVGERLALRDLPAYLPAAFLAAEDRRFYSHNGIDVFGFFRAALANIDAGKIVAGGSTITQQTAKLLFLNSDRTMARKLRELGATWELERRFSKDDILALYLNRIYLGSGAYGVDAAARTYFNKSARDVTLSEAAMLAGLTRAPSFLSPRRDLVAARTRANVVLAAMVKANMISDTEALSAQAHSATLVDNHEATQRNYIFDMAAAEARTLSMDAGGDLLVVTTIDPRLQHEAVKAADLIMAEKEKASRASQLALVSMSPDGAIRAMVGGRDYAESQFNRATQARRQPGSAFKPFVYLTALENGYTPSRRINSGPVNINGYRPKNSGSYGARFLSMATALAYSVNTAAVRVADTVGVKNVIATAQRLGIHSPLRKDASLALGSSEVTPLELVGSYAVFAAKGAAVKPYSVVEMRTQSGTVIYRHPTGDAPQIIAPKQAAMMDQMLYGAVAWGTGHRAKLPGHRVAGKTGTSSEYRDAWFVGYTENLVTGIWVGNDDYSPMNRVTGGTLPAQIWRSFMGEALRDDKLRPALVADASKPMRTPARSFVSLVPDHYANYAQ